MESSVLEEKVFHKVMKNVPFGLVVSSEGRKRKVYYVNTMAYCSGDQLVNFLTGEGEWKARYWRKRFFIKL